MSRDELITAIRRWYDLPDNECGGALHIVLDDCNVEDEHIVWCRDEWAPREGVLPPSGDYDDGEAASYRPLFDQIVAGLLAVPVAEREALIEDAHRGP